MNTMNLFGIRIDETSVQNGINKYGLTILKGNISLEVKSVFFEKNTMEVDKSLVLIILSEEDGKRKGLGQVIIDQRRSGTQCIQLNLPQRSKATIVVLLFSLSSEECQTINETSLVGRQALAYGSVKLPPELDTGVVRVKLEFCSKLQGKDPLFKRQFVLSPGDISGDANESDIMRLCERLSVHESMTLNQAKCQDGDIPVDIDMDDRIPPEPVYSHLLAAIRAFKREKKYDHCISYAKAVLTIDPVNLKARYLLFKSLIELNKLSICLDLFQSQGVMSFEEILLVGEALVKIGYLRKADTLWSYAMKFQPSLQTQCEKLRKLIQMRETIIRNYVSHKYREVATDANELLIHCPHSRSITIMFLNASLIIGDPELCSKGMRILNECLKYTRNFVQLGEVPNLMDSVNTLIQGKSITDIGDKQIISPMSEQTDPGKGISGSEPHPLSSTTSPAASASNNTPSSSTSSAAAVTVNESLNYPPGLSAPQSPSPATADAGQGKQDGNVSKNVSSNNSTGTLVNAIKGNSEGHQVSGESDKEQKREKDNLQNLMESTYELFPDEHDICPAEAAAFATNNGIPIPKMFNAPNICVDVIMLYLQYMLLFVENDISFRRLMGAIYQCPNTQPPIIEFCSNLTNLFIIKQESEVCMRRSQWSLARQSFRQMLCMIDLICARYSTLNLNNYRAYCYKRLADLALSLSLYELALSHCSKGIQLSIVNSSKTGNPEYCFPAVIYELRGDIYVRLRMYHKAIRDYESAANLMSDGERNTSVVNRLVSCAKLMAKELPRYTANHPSILTYLDNPNSRKSPHPELLMSRYLMDLLYQHPSQSHFYLLLGVLDFRRRDYTSFLTHMSLYSSLVCSSYINPSYNSQLNSFSTNASFSLVHHGNSPFVSPNSYMSSTSFGDDLCEYRLMDSYRKISEISVTQTRKRQIFSIDSFDIHGSLENVVLTSQQNAKDGMKMNDSQRGDMVRKELMTASIQEGSKLYITVVNELIFHYYMCCAFAYNINFPRAYEHARMYDHRLSQLRMQCAVFHNHLTDQLPYLMHTLPAQRILRNWISDLERKYSQAIECLKSSRYNECFKHMIHIFALPDSVTLSHLFDFNAGHVLPDTPMYCISRPCMLLVLECCLRMLENDTGTELVENYYVLIAEFTNSQNITRSASADSNSQEGRVNKVHGNRVCNNPDKMFMCAWDYSDKHFHCIYNWKSPDPQIVLYYIKFLMLKGLFVEALSLLTCRTIVFPHHESLFVVLLSILSLLIHGGLTHTASVEQVSNLKLTDDSIPLWLKTINAQNIRPVRTLEDARSDPVSKQLMNELRECVREDEYNMKLQELIDHEPACVDILYEMAARRVDLVESLLLLVQAACMSSCDSRTLIELACLFAQIGNIPTAIEFYNLAQYFHNDSAIPIPSFAWSSDYWGRVDQVLADLSVFTITESIVYLQSFLNVCPRSREVHLALLYCYYRTEDLQNMDLLLHRCLGMLWELVFEGQAQVDANGNRDMAAMLKTTWCHWDCNFRRIGVDYEMILFFVRYLLLRGDLKNASMILSSLKCDFCFHKANSLNEVIKTKRDVSANSQSVNAVADMCEAIKYVSDYTGPDQLPNGSYRTGNEMMIIRKLKEMIPVLLDKVTSLGKSMQEGKPKLLEEFELQLLHWINKNHHYENEVTLRVVTASVYLSMAEIAFRDRKFVTAISHCEYALRNNPNLHKSFQIRARSHVELGRLELACEDFDMYLSIEKGDRVCRNEYEEVRKRANLLKVNFR